jgi:hypothetical protein
MARRLFHLDEGCVAELDGDVLRHLLVLDEAVLLEVLLALLLLESVLDGIYGRNLKLFEFKRPNMAFIDF